MQVNSHTFIYSTPLGSISLARMFGRRLSLSLPAERNADSRNFVCEKS